MDFNQSEKNNLIVEEILNKRGGKFEFNDSNNKLLYKTFYELGNDRCKEIVKFSYENAILLNQRINCQLKLNHSLPKLDDAINTRSVELRFEYVKDNLLGASSDLIDDDSGIILFNIGSLIILNYLFYTHLSHNKIPKFQESNNEEKYNEPILSKYYNNAYELIKSLGIETYENLKIVKPNDYTRQRIAFDLVMISFDFLIYHEASHFTNGHTLYKKKYGGKITNIINQTLEMDADSFAICKIIDNYLIFPLVHFFEKKSNKSKELFIKSRINFIIYSIGTLLKISSENYVNINKSSLKTHAKPDHRLFMIMGCFKVYIDQQYPQTYLTMNWYNDVFNSTIHQVDHSFEQVTGIYNSNKIFSQKNIIESQQLITNLSQCYTEIYNELRKYAYFSITKYQ